MANNEFRVLHGLNVSGDTTTNGNVNVEEKLILAGVFIENDTTVTSDYTITTGKNAMTAGPVTVSAGVTVTIPDGSTWTVV